jgi:molybdenum cofactor biosynthesis enzyme MoaA
VIANKRGILAECAQAAVRVAHVPYYFHAHLNQPCNQRCIMCVPTGLHGRAVLPLEKFMGFYQRIRPYAEHLTLIGGEPLMYPWIGEVLDHLAGEPIAVTINTNATMLNDRMVGRLHALDELYLRVSIDAATRATYHAIRGTDVFQQVLAGVRRFADGRGRHAGSHIITNYVVMRRNLGEVLPFVDLAATFRPLRLAFNPVRHVGTWHHVTNGTGWEFDGASQSCGAFKDEYNDVMAAASKKCRNAGLDCDVQFL